MSVTHRRFLILLALAVAAPVLAVQSSAPLGAATVRKIEQLIRDEMALQQIPGLSVAVVKDDELRWEKGCGVSDLENQVPARTETMYRLASISKPITAVAALQQVEQGKLDLDQPVQKYVPSFPQKQWPVTCRLLLGHLGGVRHYKGYEVASTHRYQSLTDALAIFKDDPLLHEPGTKYHYTTYGYNLLGSAVEGASATSFPDYLQARIFKPAGMERIRVDDAAAIIPHRAQGYRKLRDGTLRNSILADTSNKIPGGGLCGTSGDLARFAIALQKNVLLKPTSKAAMWTRQRLRDGTETSYGLGWNVTERAGRREVAHGGAQPRVTTYLYLLPDQRCAVALMANLEGAKLPELARRMADTALEGH